MTGLTHTPHPSPRHVAIIMDGNGRWAARSARPRFVGHRAGAAAVRRTAEAAARLHLDQLTLFALSTENLRRPRTELQCLNRLFVRFLRSERDTLLANNIRLRAIGRLHDLCANVRRELDETINLTRACRGMTLCLAVNYGARAELVDACRTLVRLAAERRVTPAAIDEAALNAALYQPDMPPLDLIIRTGGDMRLSNFLLWQAAYAEIYVTPVYWPDFNETHLHRAIADFRRRSRRFGLLPTNPPSPSPLHETRSHSG